MASNEQTDAKRRVAKEAEESGSGLFCRNSFFFQTETYKNPDRPAQ
jgi:hypothetical protein